MPRRPSTKRSPKSPSSAAAASPQAPPPALAELARIRTNRVRPARDPSLQRDMDIALADITRLRRSVSAAAGAWQRAIPAPLLQRTALESLSRGVLTVRVPDAATRFELDRFLRSGGFRALSQDCPTNMTKVRITVS